MNKKKKREAAVVEAMPLVRGVVGHDHRSWCWTGQGVCAFGLQADQVQKVQLTKYQYLINSLRNRSGAASFE